MITSIGVTDAGNGTLKVIVNGEHDVADMMRRLADLELAIENAYDLIEEAIEAVRTRAYPDVYGLLHSALDELDSDYSSIAEEEEEEEEED
jgi:hypothetical protein